jgi:hypothetical protein
MHPKPSELGSQAGVGQPSTAEGDHAGTFGVVSFLLFLPKFQLKGDRLKTFDDLNMFNLIKYQF